MHKYADLTPDKVALRDAATDRSFTYFDFHSRASQIARFLQSEWQIAEGDRAALLAHNSTEYMEILYGCAKIGAILVCLNWRLAAPELEFIVNDSAPKGLIDDDEFVETAVTTLANMKQGSLQRTKTLLTNSESIAKQLEAERLAFINKIITEEARLGMEKFLKIT